MLGVGGGVGAGAGVGAGCGTQQQPKQHEPSSLKWEQPLDAHEQSHEQPPRVLQVFACANAVPSSDSATRQRILPAGVGDNKALSL